MARIYQEIELEYSKKDVFKLINEIEKYPEFVPGCRGARMLAQKDNIIEAELLISKSGYTESLVTRNTHYPYDSIKIELVRGPIKNLSGGWNLTYIQEDRTKVILDLDIVLKGNFLDIVFANIIESMMSDMVRSFVGRARVVYG